MTTITFSLHSPDRLPCFTDTARDAIRDIRTMSTQTKHRLELAALILGLIVTAASAAKVFIFLPPRVTAVERVQAEHTAELKVVNARASATDVAIAGIMPQLAAIQQGVSDIKADVRDLRNAK